MTDIKYTEGQERGSVLFGKFYLDPFENVMLLKGFSGTGKSTLVQRLLREIPKLDEMCKLLSADYVPYEVALTATTNQAAEALATSTGFTQEVTTIHKYLGLRVIVTDYRKNLRELRATKRDKRERCLIFIDEASYIDQALLTLIMDNTVDCKIVFIGDHAQLKPVQSNYMPAFSMNRNEIELTELVRFDDGPISSMVSALRKTVLEGIWPNFSDFLSPGVIEKVDRGSFEQLAQDAFKPDSGYGRSKILAYTNDTVIGYNSRMAAVFNGSTDPQPGQIMVCNEEANNGSDRVSNNSEVQIVEVCEAVERGYKGWHLQLANKKGLFFMPRNCRTARKAAHSEAVQQDDYEFMQEVLEQWIDLRPAFSCTVNKSQGSTYDTTFIDLGNILATVRGGDQLARILYVGCSRARSRMIFTGDKRG